MEFGKSWKNINLANVIDREIYDVFEIIYRHKGDARLIGGVVRDFLIGKKINDIDMGVNLPPAKIVDIFTNLGFEVNDIGSKFGTVILSLSSGKKIEITSLRKDIDTDGRYAKVKYGATWMEDASRRDFTINSLSYDLKEQKIYDYFNGLEDLKNNNLKFIGDADQRIKEDYLRILRYFRFNGAYGNIYDQDLLKIIEKNKKGLDLLSKERKASEILKIFCLEKLPDVLHYMNESQILSTIFGVENLVIPKSLEQLMKIEKFFKSSVWRRLYLFGKNNDFSAEFLTKILSLSNKQSKILKDYEKNLAMFGDFSQESLKKSVYLLGKELSWNLCLLYFAENNLLDFKEAKKIFSIIEMTNIPIFQIKSSDILSKINCQRSQLGEILQRLENIWIESNFELGRAELLNKI